MRAIIDIVLLQRVCIMRYGRHVTRIPRAKVGRPVCLRRFEITRIGPRYIPDVWTCSECGHRVRRKPVKHESNA